MSATVEPTFDDLVGPELAQQIEQHAAVVKRTADLDALVKLKFAPPHFGLLKNVGDGTGARNYRWADWLAMGLWPSRGLTLIGIECKVSRTDWLKELKTPEKAEAIAQYCDEWYIVAGDSKIVKLDELPHNWGLMTPTKSGLRVSKPAVRLSPVAVDRSFLAAIFRRATEQSVDSAVLKAAQDEGFRQGQLDLERAVKYEVDRYGKLQQKIAEFEKAAGIRMHDFEHSFSFTPDDFGKAFREALLPRRDVNRETIENLHRSATYSIEQLTKVVEATKWINDKQPEVSA